MSAVRRHGIVFCAKVTNYLHRKYCMLVRLLPIKIHRPSEEWLGKNVAFDQYFLTDYPLINEIYHKITLKLKFTRPIAMDLENSLDYSFTFG